MRHETGGEEVKDKVQEQLLAGKVVEFEADPVRIKSGAARNTRVYRPKDRTARIERYKKDQELRKATQKLRVPFVNPQLSDGFYMSQGLVLIGGVSGRGKSTVAANLIAGFLDVSKKNVVVITNEETTEAVYNRTACVLLKYSFFDYQSGRMSKDRAQEVEDMAKELASRVDVIDDDAWDMTCLEDVQAVLEHAAGSDIGLVVVDYLQTIAFSRETPTAETYRVSKQLGLYLKDYGRKVGIPIAVFAQLKTMKENSDEEFKDRVENDKTIYNHAFQAIEIVPDFDASTSKFIIHKDRFGYKQGRTLHAKFNDGRFEALDLGEV
jgi:predicted ATP-dependent serine protease